MIILNDVIIICASFIMFYKATTNNFPIFSFQQLFYFIFGFVILLVIPPFEESYLTIEKGSMSLLTIWINSFSELFTFCEHISDGIKNFFNRMKSVTSKITMNISLIRLRIIITLKVKNPESIKMWMDRHMKSIWI